MAEISNYKVSSPPHKSGPQSVRGIMLDVIIALLPCLICGVLFYGLYALMLVAICVATCMLAEQIFNKIRKKPFTADLSAIVTGLILGLNLPPRAEWYIPIIGGVFAIVIVKMLFGGLGKNFANPAATARVFLLFAYGSIATKFIAADLGNFILGDVTTSATYLGGGALQNSFLGITGYWAQVLQLFFGYVGGSIGETCVPAILAGGIYLCIRRVIDWKIPVVYVATAALMVLICYQSAREILLQLFAGGLMFGAVFMATDYATSPKWEYNRILYAVGLGIFTVIIRRFGSAPEGVSLAILIMNILVPLLDKYILPVRFGQTNRRGGSAVPVMKYAMWVLCAVIALSLAIAVPVTAVVQREKTTFLPQVPAYRYVRSVRTDDETGDYFVNVTGVAAIPFGDSVYEQPLEYVVHLDAKTYAVTDIMAIKQSTANEKYQLKPQLFIGKKPNELSEIDADSFTGATYTHNEFLKMLEEAFRAAQDYVRSEMTSYQYVNSIFKRESTGDYLVNVTGVAAIPFGDSVYEQSLEYVVHLDTKTYAVTDISAIKQSTANEKYQLKPQLFIGKKPNELGGIDADNFTGATYTHNEFVKMLNEAFRAAMRAGGELV